jgi:hypothetical protein
MRNLLQRHEPHEETLSGKVKTLSEQGLLSLGLEDKREQFPDAHETCSYWRELLAGAFDVWGEMNKESYPEVSPPDPDRPSDHQGMQSTWVSLPSYKATWT